MLSRSDDLRHPLGPDPLARESLYWSVSLPEKDLFLFAYFFVDSANTAGVLCGALQNGSVEPVELETVTDIPFGDQDLNRFHAGPLAVTQAGPLNSCTLDFAGQRIDLSLTFTGAHRAFDFASSPHGVPPGTASNRFEQGGLVRGHFRIRDKQGDISALGWRDHSWGTRDWVRIQHYKLITMTDGDSFSVCLFEGFINGRVHTNGFVDSGGRLEPIVSATVDSEYDLENLPSVTTMRIVDSAGRSLEAIGRAGFAGAVLLGAVEICSAPTTFDFGGKSIQGNVEYMWPAGYRQHVRNASTVSAG
jgi:hypothetical protein